MKIIRGGAAVGVLLAVGLATAGPASAAIACGTPAVDAVYQTVVTPAAPAVTEDRKVIDVAFVPGIPEVPAVPAVPAVEEVSHMETIVDTPEQVIEHPAVTHEEKQFYVLRGWDKEYAPTLDSPGWKPNDGNHKGHPDPGANTPYTTGKDDPENPKSRNWFYYSLVTVVDEEAWTETIPAVTHQEKVIDVAYVPAIPGKPAIPAVPEVPEVSHIETVVITPAIPESSTTILLSDTIPAGPPCPEEPEKPVVNPVVDKPADTPDTPAASTPETLAFTGTNTTALYTLAGALALALGACAVAGYSHLRRSEG